MKPLKYKAAEVLIACLIVAPAAINQNAKRTATAERQETKIEIVKAAGGIAVWEPEAWKQPNPCDSVYIEEMARKPKKKVVEKTYTEAELELLANVVTAESLNQGEKGWTLVCDVILNRVNDGDFPDTITEVIYQKNQFSCTFDGGMQRWPTDDKVKETCRKELKDGASYPGVLYYTAGRFSQYGTPLFRYKDHCFSGK